MHDAPSPSLPPAGERVSRAPRRDGDRLAWAALARGLRRRRVRGVAAIVAAGIVHLVVAAWVLSGFLGASHALDPAAKAHAVVALLQTTRIARDGKHRDATESAQNTATKAPTLPARDAFQPLLIAALPPAAAPEADSRRTAPDARKASVKSTVARKIATTSDTNAANARTAAPPAHSQSTSPTGTPDAASSPRSADEIEATAARLALAAGVTAASASADTTAASAKASDPLTTAKADARTPDATDAIAGNAPHVGTSNAPGAGSANTSAGNAHNASTAAPSGAASAGGAGVPPGSATPGAAQQGVRFALMPSSDLVYNTFYNGAQNQSGTLHWRTDGQHYSLLVSMPVPFIGTFSYHSEGHIDDYGIAPDTYTETRGRRGESVSHFIRDGGTPHVSFTRSPNDVPLPVGAQDRFSMIFQLASLVRADPSRYTPGVTRLFDVIDSNSAETWPIQTIGPDQTMLGNRQVATLHFMRLPRKPGDKRRIDVWLAPSMNWIPVRIMQTEPNGTQIELVFHARLPPAGALDDSANAPSDAPHDTGRPDDAATAAVSAHQDGP